MPLHGEVKISYMTEEERLAYIQKHPIKPIKRKEKAFSNIHTYGERVKNRESGTN